MPLLTWWSELKSEDELDQSILGFPSQLIHAFNLMVKLTNLTFFSFNPLTPVPPVTALDEPWPFYYFWGHHFWPKLASSILNLCSRKRSFQWCPDRSDQPNGALHVDMHKNAQNVEWKTRSKISCHYTWLLRAKICPSRWRFLRSFLTTRKPSRRSITAAKRKEKEKKGRRKKIPKIEKPKDVGDKSQISISVQLIFHERISLWVFARSAKS